VSSWYLEPHAFTMGGSPFPPTIHAVGLHLFGLKFAKSQCRWIPFSLSHHGAYEARLLAIAPIGSKGDAVEVISLLDGFLA